MPCVNLEQGFASLATLREHPGNMTSYNCSTDSKHHKQNGKERLNLNIDSSNIGLLRALAVQ